MKLAMEVAKTFEACDLSNTLRHLKGNQKSLQSHAVTMFKIPLPALIHKRFLSSRCHVLPGELSTWPSFLPRMQQVHGKSASPWQRKESVVHRNAFFLGISLYTHAVGNPHLARVCKKPRALNLSHFYVGT